MLLKRFSKKYFPAQQRETFWLIFKHKNVGLTVNDYWRDLYSNGFLFNFSLSFYWVISYFFLKTAVVFLTSAIAPGNSLRITNFETVYWNSFFLFWKTAQLHSLLIKALVNLIRLQKKTNMCQKVARLELKTALISNKALMPEIWVFSRNSKCL